MLSLVVLLPPTLTLLLVVFSLRCLCRIWKFRRLLIRQIIPQVEMLLLQIRFTRATYPDLRACPFYVGQQLCHQVLVEDSANPHGNAGNLGNNFRVVTAIGRPATGDRDRVQLTLSAENQPVLPNGRRVVPAPAQGQKVSLEDPAQNYLQATTCLLYTSPSPRDRQKSRMPSSA